MDRAAGRVELAAGALATLTGFAGLAYGFYGANAIIAEVRPQAVILFGLAILSLLGTSIGAYFHVLRSRRGARWIVRTSALYIVAFTFLAVLSIGSFVLPSALFALIAAAGSGDRRRPTAPAP